MASLSLGNWVGPEERVVCKWMEGPLGLLWRDDDDGPRDVCRADSVDIMSMKILLRLE